MDCGDVLDQGVAIVSLMVDIKLKTDTIVFVDS